MTGATTCRRKENHSPAAIPQAAERPDGQRQKGSPMNICWSPERTREPRSSRSPQEPRLLLSTEPAELDPAVSGAHLKHCCGGPIGRTVWVLHLHSPTTSSGMHKGPFTDKGQCCFPGDISDLRRDTWPGTTPVFQVSVFRRELKLTTENSNESNILSPLDLQCV